MSSSYSGRFSRPPSAQQHHQQGPGMVGKKHRAGKKHNKKNSAAAAAATAAVAASAAARAGPPRTGKSPTKQGTNPVVDEDASQQRKKHTEEGGNIQQTVPLPTLGRSRMGEEQDRRFRGEKDEGVSGVGIGRSAHSQMEQLHVGDGMKHSVPPGGADTGVPGYPHAEIGRRRGGGGGGGGGGGSGSGSVGGYVDCGDDGGVSSDDGMREAVQLEMGAVIPKPTIGCAGSSSCSGNSTLDRELADEEVEEGKEEGGEETDPLAVAETDSGREGGRGETEQGQRGEREGLGPIMSTVIDTAVVGANAVNRVKTPSFSQVETEAERHNEGSHRSSCGGDNTIGEHVGEPEYTTTIDTDAAAAAAAGGVGSTNTPSSLLSSGDVDTGYGVTIENSENERQENLGEETVCGGVGGGEEAGGEGFQRCDGEGVTATAAEETTGDDNALSVSSLDVREVLQEKLRRRPSIEVLRQVAVVGEHELDANREAPLVSHAKGTLERLFVRDRLKERLSFQRPEGALRVVGILPSFGNAAPSLQGVQGALARSIARNSVGHLLGNPMRETPQDLARRGILLPPETGLASTLQATAVKLERQISRDFLKHKLETRPSLEQVMAIDGHGFGGGGGELAGGVGIASGLQGSGNVGGGGGGGGEGEISPLLQACSGELELNMRKTAVARMLRGRPSHEDMMIPGWMDPSFPISSALCTTTATTTTTTTTTDTTNTASDIHNVHNTTTTGLSASPRYSECYDAAAEHAFPTAGPTTHQHFPPELAEHARARGEENYSVVSSSEEEDIGGGSSRRRRGCGGGDNRHHRRYPFRYPTPPLRYPSASPPPPPPATAADDDAGAVVNRNPDRGVGRVETVGWGRASDRATEGRVGGIKGLLFEGGTTDAGGDRVREEGVALAKGGEGGEGRGGELLSEVPMVMIGAQGNITASYAPTDSLAESSTSSNVRNRRGGEDLPTKTPATETTDTAGIATRKVEQEGAIALGNSALKPPPPPATATTTKTTTSTTTQVEDEENNDTLRLDDHGHLPHAGRHVAGVVGENPGLAISSSAASLPGGKSPPVPSATPPTADRSTNRSTDGFSTDHSLNRSAFGIDSNSKNNDNSRKGPCSSRGSSVSTGDRSTMGDQSATRSAENKDMDLTADRSTYRSTGCYMVHSTQDRFVFDNDAAATVATGEAAAIASTPLTGNRLDSRVNNTSANTMNTATRPQQQRLAARAGRQAALGVGKSAGKNPEKVFTRSRGSREAAPGIGTTIREEAAIGGDVRGDVMPVLRSRGLGGRGIGGRLCTGVSLPTGKILMGATGGGGGGGGGRGGRTEQVKGGKAGDPGVKGRVETPRTTTPTTTIPTTISSITTATAEIVATPRTTPRKAVSPVTHPEISGQYSGRGDASWCGGGIVGGGSAAGYGGDGTQRLTATRSVIEPGRHDYYMALQACSYLSASRAVDSEGRARLKQLILAGDNRVILTLHRLQESADLDEMLRSLVEMSKA